MKSLKILILCLCFVLPSFGFAGNTKRQENKIPVVETTVQNGFPNVFRPIGNWFKYLFRRKQQTIVCYFASVSNLTLSRNEVVASCLTNQNVCPGSKGIGIYTEPDNPNNDVLTYQYIVSGGKIIGEGSKVAWDLSGEKSGTYTITAGVDDGCGVCGTTVTKEIKVIECPDCK